MDKNKNINIQDFVGNFESLKQVKQSETQWWNECRGLVDINKHDAIDNTATYYLQKFAAGIHGLLTNSAVKFLRLSTKDKTQMENQEIKYWIGKLEEQVYLTFNNSYSNFYNTLAEVYLSLGLYGLAVIWMDSTLDKKEGIPIRFSSVPVQQCYIAEDYTEQVNTIYREFEMTNISIYSKWPETCGDKITQAIKGNKRYETKKILHAVEPDYANDNVDSFISVFIDLENKTVFEQEILDKNPYSVGRWNKQSGFTYGFSPMKLAIPIVKSLNKLVELFQKGLKHQVDPLYFVSARIGRNFNLDSQRRILIVDSEVGVGPDFVREFTGNARIDTAMNMIERDRQRVAEAMYVSLFESPDTRTKTATEAQHIALQQIRLVAPILSRFEFEVLRKLAEYTINSILQYRLIDKPPKVPKGFDVDINFVSPIQQAQNEVEKTNLERYTSFIMGLAQANPTILDNINLDILTRRSGSLLYIDSDIFVDEKEVEKKRAERQKQAEAQQQQEAAMRQEEMEQKQMADIARAGGQQELEEGEGMTYE